MVGKRVESRILEGGPNLPAKMESARVQFVAENPVRFEEIRKYPYLIYGERRIKFNPQTGAIYISSWRQRKEGEETEEVSFEGEIILAQRGRKPKGSVMSRWNEYPDIETAIRGVGHVLERHDPKSGEMVNKTREVIHWVRDSLSDFKTSEVNRENLPDFAQKASDVLAGAGFVEAHKPIKQEITQQLLKASDLDSKKRFNPLVSRTRLASAWLKLTRELLFARGVRQKYSSLLTSLGSERDFERFCLEQAKSIMSEIMEMSPQNKEIAGKLNVLKGFARRFLMPNVIKVAPYRGPTLTSVGVLFGVRTEYGRSLMREILKEDLERAEEIFTLAPIDQIFRTQPDKGASFAEIKGRVGEALDLIDESLKKGREEMEKS